MSKRDVDEYYNKITNDYKEMVDTLKEMEELAAQDIVNPDKVEDLKKVVEPMKINYERISWIMFLLNQPNRKFKQEKYKNSNKKFLEHCNTTEHEENLEVLGTINNVWTGNKTE